MKWRRLTRRKGLALAGATLGIVVLWGLFRSPLGNVPDPPVKVTINGTDEPQTLTETATLPPHGERGFQAPLPPTGSARPLRIGILYALEAPWFRQRMQQFEWDLHR